MEYQGKLYGKIGEMYFDTGVTSKDFDKLTQEHKEMLDMLQKLIVTFSGEDLELYQATRLQEAERLIKKATTI